MEHVAFGENGPEAADNVAHEVNADQVIQAKNAGLWNAHRPTENGVSLLRLEAQPEGGMQGGLNGEYTHAIAEKPGRVIADDNALAHARFIE